MKDEKDGGKEVKRPNRLKMPQMAYRGTGVYTPPPATKEKGA